MPFLRLVIVTALLSLAYPIQAQVQPNMLDETVPATRTTPSTEISGSPSPTVSLSQLTVPKSARNAYNKARDFMDQQRWSDAATFAAKAIEIHPAYTDAWSLRGLIRLQLGDVSGAVSFLRQAVAFDGNNAAACFALGAALNRAGRFNEAAQALQHGLALSPRAWQGLFELGKAYLGNSDFRAALRLFDQSLDAAPSAFPAIHLFRAHALLGLKDTASGIHELEAFLDSEPDSPQSRSARDLLTRIKSR